jgi:hypothetical protein
VLVVRDVLIRTFSDTTEIKPKINMSSADLFRYYSFLEKYISKTFALTKKKSKERG